MKYLMVFDIKVKILKEICVRYKLVKKIERFWSNEIVGFKVDCE